MEIPALWALAEIASVRKPKVPTDAVSAGGAWGWFGFGLQGIWEDGYLTNPNLNSGRRADAFLPPNSPAAKTPTALEVLVGMRADLKLAPPGSDLHAGFAWICGRPPGGPAAGLCLPLLTAPEHASNLSIRRTGDIEITGAVPEDLHADLLARSEWGGGGLRLIPPPDYRLVRRFPKLISWLKEIAKAAGYEPTSVWAYETDPRKVQNQNEVVLVIGTGLYLVTEAQQRSARAAALRAAAAARHLERTAAAPLFRMGTDLKSPSPKSPSPKSPAAKATEGSNGPSRQTSESGDAPIPYLPMDEIQADAVRLGLSEPLSAITGPPGTGKTQTVVNLALNAVHRGQSVLVVTGSNYAADVLADAFERAPGPDPLRFGGLLGGTDVVMRLSDRLAQRNLDGADLATADRTAAARLGRARATAEDLIRAEVVLRRWYEDPSERVVDLDALDRAGDTADLQRYVGRRGPWPRMRLWMARSADRLGCPPGPGQSGWAARLTELRVISLARSLGGDGVVLAPVLDRLFDAEQASAAATAAHDAERYAGTDGRSDTRSAIGSLIIALGGPISSRANALAGVNTRTLLRSVPLWLGTVRDVEDALPLESGMFDLAIIDEAAQLDCAQATGSAVRASRAVFCGDPRQLGVVSFASNEDIEAACAQYGVDPASIDPRSVSAYDRALGAGPLTALRRHYRSVPHLIGFSAREFSAYAADPVTRNPDNERLDSIDVCVVDGKRARGINRAEIAECLRLVDESSARGATSIGLVTPSRPQADALREAALKRWHPEQLDRLGLIIGTVHAFQGAEVDHAILSWVIGSDEPASAWKFLNQSRLFNVMVTRARRHVTVVTSCAEPPGLAGHYLRWASGEELGRLPATPISRWASRVADALEDVGFTVDRGYSLGSESIDLVATASGQHIAVICDPHPRGPAAHFDRDHLLRATGWNVVDVMASRYSRRLGELAIELHAAVTEGIPTPSGVQA